MCPDDDEEAELLPEALRPTLRAGRPRVRLFRGDEMSSGLGSKLRKRAGQVIGAAPKPTGVVSRSPLPPSEDPTRLELKKRAAEADVAAKRATMPGGSATKAGREGSVTNGRALRLAEGGARGGATSKKPKGGDTFVRKKMREAEKNLPEWDPDDDTVT